MPDRNGTTPTSGSTPASDSTGQSQQPTCADRTTDMYVDTMTDRMLRQLGHQTSGSQQ